MLRYSAIITTRSVLTTTTLIGLLAVIQAAALHRCMASEWEQSQSPFAGAGIRSPSSTCNVASYPVQLAVLLEGFVYHPLVEPGARAATSMAREPA